MRSGDGGRTWTGAHSLPAGDAGWTELIPFGDIWVRADGKLHASCYQGEIGDPAASTRIKRWRSWHLLSDDDGATWRRVSLVGPRHNETDLFPLGKNRWLAAAPAALPSIEPDQTDGFLHARITDAWAGYVDLLSFGRGQTLALLDDGCTMSAPEWNVVVAGVPKVRVTFDAVDGDDDPKHEGRGYHGTTIGIPSSVFFQNKRGVAFNNQVAVVRSLECCHCSLADAESLARALEWVIDNHATHHITTVNLAPVDDLAHAEPLPTAIDAKLATLRDLGIWVSAPAGNHNFTDGISWPASQPNCFAIGAVRPGRDEVHLDRQAKIDLVVSATATSSSNAIVCGAAMILREAIVKTGYDWKSKGTDIAAAMMKIFQETGKTVHDPGTHRDYRRLDLLSALDFVFAEAKNTKTTFRE